MGSAGTRRSGRRSAAGGGRRDGCGAVRVGKRGVARAPLGVASRMLDRGRMLLKRRARLLRRLHAALLAAFALVHFTSSMQCVSPISSHPRQCSKRSASPRRRRRRSQQRPQRLFQLCAYVADRLAAARCQQTRCGLAPAGSEPRANTCSEPCARTQLPRRGGQAVAGRERFGETPD
jgi:hypothetical protein